MFRIKDLARPDRWLWGFSCPPAPAPSVPLRLAVEMPLWSPLIPTARAEAGTTRLWLASLSWPGEDEVAPPDVPLSLHQLYSEPRMSWSDKPQAGSNVLLPPQRLSSWKIKCVGCVREEWVALSPFSFQALACYWNIYSNCSRQKCNIIFSTYVASWPVLPREKFRCEKHNHQSQDPVTTMNIGLRSCPESSQNSIGARQPGQGISCKIKNQQCF